MRILLVGHRGYIGSGLGRALSRRHEVIGWGSAEDVTRIAREDIDRHGVAAVINCSVAYDRSSTTVVPGSPTETVNIEGVRALVEAIRGTDVRLIQISTKDVFGPVYGPSDVVERPTRYELPYLVNERQPFDPRTAYAKSKLIGEQIAERHPRATVIRLSTCYTDLYHPRGAWIMRMVASSVAHGRIRIEGSGKQVRDPLHVDDLADLVERVLAADAAVARLTLNAGGGADNIRSVQAIARMIDPRAEIERAAGGDLGFAFDDRLARETLGWRPRIAIADGIARLRKTVAAAMRPAGHAIEDSGSR